MTRSMWAIIQVDSFDEGYHPRWLVRSLKNSPFEQLIGTVSRTDKRKTFLNVSVLWFCQSLWSVNPSLCLIPRPSSQRSTFYGRPSINSTDKTELKSESYVPSKKLFQEAIWAGVVLEMTFCYSFWCIWSNHFLKHLGNYSEYQVPGTVHGGYRIQKLPHIFIGAPKYDSREI